MRCSTSGFTADMFSPADSDTSAIAAIMVFAAPKAFCLLQSLASGIQRRFGLRSVSSYVHDQYHQIQAANAGQSGQAELVYNPAEVRDWLQRFAGGRVTLERNDKTGVAVVTLDHSGKRNALSGAMMVQLSDIVGTLESWAEGCGRAVILRGAAGLFCSGGDLEFMGNIADGQSGGRMCLFMQDVTTRFRHLPLLTCELVEGVALGGGAELSLCADWRLVTPATKIGFVQGRLGITTGWGGGTQLARLIGYRRALEALSSTRIFSASDAVEIGLADRILAEGEDPLGGAEKFLSELTRISAKSARIFKLTCLRATDGSTSTDESLRAERNLFSQVWGGPEHLKALDESRHFKKY